MKNTIEIWMPVVGHPNYEVSNNGNVRSINHKTFQKSKDGYRFNTYKGKILKPHISNSGYYFVHIDKKNKNIHRLVAESFIPNPNGFKIVNHIDGNKFNNSLNNLEWCTSSHNIKHAYSNGLLKPNKTDKQILQVKKWSAKGVSINKSKQKNIICIETGETFENTRDCSLKMNIDRHTLMRHVNNTPINRSYVKKDGTKSTYITYVENVKGFHYKYAS